MYNASLTCLEFVMCILGATLSPPQSMERGDVNNYSTHAGGVWAVERSDCQLTVGSRVLPRDNLCPPQTVEKDRVSSGSPIKVQVGWGWGLRVMLGEGCLPQTVERDHVSLSKVQKCPPEAVWKNNPSGDHGCSCEESSESDSDDEVALGMQRAKQVLERLECEEFLKVLYYACPVITNRFSVEFTAGYTK